tara:strand:+ start:497 stop:1141 length:645 start_codon:yes stop_codon:yes gene_type:complete
LRTAGEQGVRNKQAGRLEHASVKEDGCKAAVMQRKWIMRQYWRLQQSQTLISMVFWCTTLTLLIWPYVSWRFDPNSSISGIPMTYYGLGLIAFCVLFTVLSIGYIYDQFLALWKEQRTVDTERNPFGTYAMIPVNTVIMGMLNKILRDHSEGNEEIEKTCNWVDEWLAWSAKQEIWARSQKFWDESFSEPVPDLFFMPEGSIAAARDVGKKLED